MNILSPTGAVWEHISIRGAKSLGKQKLAEGCKLEDDKHIKDKLVIGFL